MLVPAVWQSLKIETSLGQLVVPLGEAIKAKLTWRNYTLAEGAEVIVAALPAVYNPAANVYALLTFVEEGIEWYFGVCMKDTAPAKETEKTIELPTLAYVTAPDYPVLAAVAYVGPTDEIGTLTRAGRVVGISRIGFDAWSRIAYSSAGFRDVLQITPGLAIPIALTYVKG